MVIIPPITHLSIATKCCGSAINLKNNNAAPQNKFTATPASINVLVDVFPARRARSIMKIAAAVEPANARRYVVEKGPTEKAKPGNTNDNAAHKVPALAIPKV